MKIKKKSMKMKVSSLLPYLQYCTARNEWKWMKMNENEWKWMKMNGNEWKWMEMNGNEWMKINEN